MKEIHVCIASDQSLANVIPVLMREPKYVHLIVSSEKKSKGEALGKFLRTKETSFEIHENAPDSGLPRILQYASDLAHTIADRHKDARIVLNATGGNKLMALAFVQVFRQFDSEVLYTDTQHSQLEFLEKDRPPEPMRDVLDVPTYLEIQGMAYQRAASDIPVWQLCANQRKALTKYLADNASRLSQFFGVINILVNGSSETPGALSSDGSELVNPGQEFRTIPGGMWAKLLQQSVRLGLLDWLGGKEIVFKNADAARYFGGFWLEEYAWHVARDCGLHDVRCGVEGTWSGTAAQEAPRNEFDLLTVHRNRMLVVECKTLRLDREVSPEKGQNIVSKLESLGRNAGGLFGTSLLLSARDVQSSVVNRCKSFVIPLRQGAEIKTLRRDLLDWKEHGRFNPTFYAGES